MFNHQNCDVINALSLTQVRQVTMTPTRDNAVFASGYLSALLDLSAAIGERDQARIIQRTIRRLADGQQK